MPVGQDLPLLSDAQISHIMLMGGDRPSRPRMSRETWMGLNRPNVGAKLAQQFDLMFCRPRYARNNFVVGISAREDLGIVHGKTRERYIAGFQGKSADGLWLYDAVLGPTQLVDLSHDTRVVEIDESQTFFKRQNEIANSRMNWGVVRGKLRTGNCTISDGLSVVATEEIPDLRSNLSERCHVRLSHDQDGQCIYTLYERPNLNDLAYISAQPQVKAVYDSKTYNKMNSLKPEGLPEFRPSQGLAAEFANKVYRKGFWGKIGNLVYWASERSPWESVAKEELGQIVANGFMPFINDIFARASRGVEVSFGDNEKKALGDSICDHLPDMASEYFESLRVRRGFSIRVVQEVFAQAAASVTVLTTYSGAEKLQITSGNHDLGALRLKVN